MKLPLTLAALLPLVAAAQAPSLTLTTVAPTRNAMSAPRSGPATFNFSQAVNGAASLRMSSNQWSGHRAGAAGGDGTAALNFQARQAFAPGEEVSVTVPATVRAALLGGARLGAGQVVQFRAAAGPGTGSFTAGQRVYVNGSSGVKAPTLADMDNDGNLDLLYADDQGTSSVGVFMRRGDGRGGFGNATLIVSGLESTSVVTADFNQDGRLDVVTTGFRSGTYEMALFLNNGTAAFSRAASIGTTAIPQRPCVGDVNADGFLDVVFLGYAPNTTPSGPGRNDLLVGLGDGTGNLTALPVQSLAYTSGLTLGATTLHLADLDRDGRLDLLFGYGGANQLLPYLGNGAGGFTAIAGAGMAPGLAQVLADFTGDGVLDVVTYGASGLQVSAGTGTGGFGASPVATFAATGGFGRAAADIDGDGDLDLLTSESTPVTGGGFTRTVRGWLNNGTGTSFAPGFSLAGQAGELATGDVNNDGTLDLVAYDQAGAGGLGPFIAVGLNTALATAPTLTSFTPGTGSTGTVVTLTGTNFTGASTVLLGGVPVSGFVVVSGTNITFSVPAGSGGGLITVITPTGQATSATPLLLPTATRADAAAWPVAVFPNPAHGTATVQVPAVAGASQMAMALYNALGQVVRRYPAATLSAAGVSTTLDVNGVAAGLYTLRLTADGTTVSKKLAVE